MENFNWCGGKIIVSDLVPKKLVQTKFPRSKKRRIREKWAKRYTKEVPQALVLNYGDCILPRSIYNEMQRYWDNRYKDCLEVGNTVTVSANEKYSDTVTTDTIKNVMEMMKSIEVKTPDTLFSWRRMDDIIG